MSDSSDIQPLPAATEINAPGRKSWVFGFKLALFLCYTVEWQRARDAGVDAAGEFYTNLTKIFISLYGWHHNRWLDKVIGEVDVAIWQTIGQDTDLTPEEVDKRRKYFVDLRKVCVHVIDILHLLSADTASPGHY